MKNYYLAYMKILNPILLSNNNTDITLECKRIIVEKTIFGYQEIFTNHKFYVINDVLVENQKPNNKEYQWTIKNSKILSKLRKGETFFLLDTKYIRIATKKDVNEYIKDFCNNDLKLFYEKKKQEKLKQKQEHQNKKQENTEIKKLIKNYKKIF